MNVQSSFIINLSIEEKKEEKPWMEKREKPWTDQGQRFSMKREFLPNIFPNLKSELRVRV